VEDRSVKRLGTIWRLIVFVGLISAIAYLALHREFLQRSLLEKGLCVSADWLRSYSFSFTPWRLCCL